MICIKYELLFFQKAMVFLYLLQSLQENLISYLRIMPIFNFLNTYSLYIVNTILLITYNVISPSVFKRNLNISLPSHFNSQIKRYISLNYYCIKSLNRSYMLHHSFFESLLLIYPSKLCNLDMKY